MYVKIGRGYIYAIQYYIVWCTKYRRKVLTPPIEKKLHNLFNQIASGSGFVIEEINGELDHIHLLINCSPQHYIPNMIKALKGVSARLLVNNPRLKSQACKKAIIG